MKRPGLMTETIAILLITLGIGCGSGNVELDCEKYCNFALCGGDDYVGCLDTCNNCAAPSLNGWMKAYYNSCVVDALCVDDEVCNEDLLGAALSRWSELEIACLRHLDSCGEYPMPGAELEDCNYWALLYSQMSDEIVDHTIWCLDQVCESDEGACINRSFTPECGW